jgi:Hint module
LFFGPLLILFRLVISVQSFSSVFPLNLSSNFVCSSATGDNLSLPSPLFSPSSAPTPMPNTAAPSLAPSPVDPSSTFRTQFLSTPPFQVPPYNDAPSPSYYWSEPAYTYRPINSPPSSNPTDATLYPSTPRFPAIFVPIMTRYPTPSPFSFIGSQAPVKPSTSRPTIKSSPRPPTQAPSIFQIYNGVPVLPVVPIGRTARPSISLAPGATYQPTSTPTGRPTSTPTGRPTSTPTGRPASTPSGARSPTGAVKPSSKESTKPTPFPFPSPIGTQGSPVKPSTSSFDKDCFSGSETVTLESGGSKVLSEVVLGDRILTSDVAGDLSYSEVSKVKKRRVG